MSEIDEIEVTILVRAHSFADAQRAIACAAKEASKAPGWRELRGINLATTSPDGGWSYSASVNVPDAARIAALREEANQIERATREKGFIE